MTRTEVQRSEGTRIRVVNNGVGAVQDPDGSIRRQSSNNTIAERVEHIPALSLLSDWQSSNIEVSYVRSDTLNGRPVLVISLSYIPTADPQWADFYRSTTETIFFIDQSTSVVSKLQYKNFADNDTNFSEKIEILFTDYRSVSGVLVPFSQSTYADGLLRSTIALTSIVFNSGLADSEFSVPGGN